ncbi:hypothetical protein ACLOJK_022005 [Asimina triloba]
MVASSDCDSIEVMVDNHHWLNDKPEDAVRQVWIWIVEVLNPNYLKSAVEQGKVREQIGDFYGSSEFESLGKEDICSEDRMELSVEAARQGTVLLENDHDTLPLDASKLQSVAVIGPHAAATSAMIGNFAVIHVGLDLSVEAECHDQPDLLLPGYQTLLINEVVVVADHPIILVIFLSTLSMSPLHRITTRSGPSFGLVTLMRKVVAPSLM